MKKFLVFLFVIPFFAGAQKYNTLLIPDSLKKNANVVKREEEYILEIKSPGKIVTKEHYVYTVLGESGNEYGRYVTGYSKLQDINSVTCTLYDFLGKEIKRIKKKDMQDFSYDDHMSLATDDRYKVYDFYYKVYPYTVEFEEEDESSDVRDFHDWVPLGASKLSVQHSKYTIIAPKNYQIRYKNRNTDIQPVISEDRDKKIYTWEVNNLPARLNESNAPSWDQLVPWVMMAPSDFEVQGFSGNMSTWENYGKFIYQLVKGRDVLPADVKEKVHSLTDGISDRRKKVEVLYDFLQKNTHYISIQFGIGGWQPFDAAYVAQRKYGDCKALSNFMVALLKEAGIQAKYVEIMAGSDARPMVEDFTSSQSNHVISCVPMGADTLWLECTSQTKSPGFMGSFTGNRKALIIDETGAHVVKTPYYSSKDNRQNRKIEAKVDQEGNLDSEMLTEYTGIKQEVPHILLNEVTKDFRDKYLNRILNLPTYEVTKNTYLEKRGILPGITESLHVLSPGYANITGKRLFITPNVATKSMDKFPADSARQYDIVIDEAFTETDTAILQIPSGFQAESVPSEINLTTKFGKYHAAVEVKPGQLIYYRQREQYDGRFPPKDYQDLVKYYEQVFKADRARVVLVK